jgi:hypothetical protein
MRRIALALALLPLPVLAQDPVALGDPPSEAPVEWLGTEAHLVALGTVDGRPVSITLTGPEAEAALSAERHHMPGHAGWRYGALVLRLDLGDEGLVLRFGHEDFLQMPPPVIVPVAALPEPMGLMGNAALALLPEGAAIAPASAGGWAGVLSLWQDEGERDAEMLLLDGSVGGVAELSRGEDLLNLSFTAPVTGFLKEE